MTTTTIPAIETSYKGYRFRSRQEARWAVFLDRAGIKWDYEPEGYVLEGGEPYLPDFLLEPNTPQATWLEIKGKFPDGEEITKAKKLADGTGIRTYLYFGSFKAPGAGLTAQIKTWNDFFQEWGPVPLWSNEQGWMYRASDAFAWEARLEPTAFRFDPGQQRAPRSGFWYWTDCPNCGHVVLKLHGMIGWCPELPAYDGDSLPPGVSPDPAFGHETDRILAAFAAARRARFEHGEKG